MWPSGHVKTVQIAANKDASRLLDREDDAQSECSKMVAFSNVGWGTVPQENSEKPYITKRVNSCKCKWSGGKEGWVGGGGGGEGGGGGGGGGGLRVGHNF